MPDHGWTTRASSLDPGRTSLALRALAARRQAAPGPGDPHYHYVEALLRAARWRRARRTCADVAVIGLVLAGLARVFLMP